MTKSIYACINQMSESTYVGKLKKPTNLIHQISELFFPCEHER